MLEMPEIGTYKDVASYLKLARATIYRMVCAGEFKKGIYLGRGRFNMSYLKSCIENGSFLHGKKG